MYDFIPVLCSSVSHFTLPAGDLALFSPFLNWDLGEESLSACVLVAVGWLTVSLKPIWGRTLPSFADAPVTPWQRCPGVVPGVAAAFSWKASVWACSGCGGRQGMVPSLGKLYHREGTVTYCGCRCSSTALPGAVAHVRQVTVSCSSPLLAWLFLLLGQEGESSLDILCPTVLLSPGSESDPSAHCNSAVSNILGKHSSRTE